MIYLKLFITFFKIGLFCFGGGYAMIPMVEREIENHGWITIQEFVNIIAISEMTPGPIAVNAATFVGYRTAGILGGAFATLGVTMPSLILILIISRFLFKFKERNIVKGILYGIRPVVVALIFGAVFFIARTSVFTTEIISGMITDFVENPLKYSTTLLSMVLIIVNFFVLIRFRIHPFLIIVASGSVTVVLFFAGIL